MSTRDSLKENIFILESAVEKAEQHMAQLRNERDRRLRRHTREVNWIIGWYALWDEI